MPFASQIQQEDQDLVQIHSQVVCGMQDCLSLGKPLLIENVEEELDPVLDPVLDRRIIRKGKSMTIALADKEAS